MGVNPQTEEKGEEKLINLATEDPKKMSVLMKNQNDLCKFKNNGISFFG